MKTRLISLLLPVLCALLVIIRGAYCNPRPSNVKSGAGIQRLLMTHPLSRLDINNRQVDFDCISDYESIYEYVGDECSEIIMELRNGTAQSAEPPTKEQTVLFCTSCCGMLLRLYVSCNEPEHADAVIELCVENRANDTCLLASSSPPPERETTNKPGPNPDSGALNIMAVSTVLLMAKFTYLLM